MKMKNIDIFAYADKLNSTFGDENNSLVLPIRVSFFLQKNIDKLTNAAKDIENARLKIAQLYGTLNEDQTAYNVAPEYMEEASAQLQELFTLEQDIPLHIFKLDDFDNVELSTSQMNALFFMIEDEDITE